MPPPPGPIGTDLADVIAHMEQIDADLPHDDGVRAFNHMYLLTTHQVSAALADQDFADPEFMRRLDVVFANEYFSAVDARDRPRAWRPLFDARDRRGIAPLQFAIAGMNAHINYDLARALVATSTEMGSGLPAAGARRKDFLEINRVLAQTQDSVRAAMLTGALGLADQALGRADDRAALWGIEAAREFAWSSAQTLLVLGPGFVGKAFLRNLDRAVGLTSKLLLDPF